ncbi:MAG TPA: biopolymer transporter ExbD [bacterium]|nr:biopolymer transporter ExbD [bacterium]HPN30520.1 biopolymer transporter ExbD [bacterium]
MRFKFFKHDDESTPELDIAPMVDLVFTLLIFFMATSTFMLQPGFKIELPEASSTDNINSEYLTIYINQNEEIFLNDKRTSLDSLGSEIQKNLPALKESSISVNADYRVEYGLVIKLTDIAKLAGVKNVILTTQPGDVQDFNKTGSNKKPVFSQNGNKPENQNGDIPPVNQN